MDKHTFLEECKILWEANERFDLSINLLKFDTNTLIRNVLEKYSIKEVDFKGGKEFKDEEYKFKGVAVRPTYVDQDDGNGSYTPIMYDDIVAYDKDNVAHSIYGDEFEVRELFNLFEDILKHIAEWIAN